MAEQVGQPEDDRELNRHYDIICLTLTTIGGATLAAVLLLSDTKDVFQGKTESPPSFPHWIRIILATLAVGAYAVMTATSRMAILQRPKPNLILTEQKRRLTSWVFNILMGIAIALVLVAATTLATVMVETFLNRDNTAEEEQQPEGIPPASGCRPPCIARPCPDCSSFPFTHMLVLG